MPPSRPSTQPLFARLAVVIAVGLAVGCRAQETPPPGDIAVALAALAAPTLAGPAFDPAAIKGKPALVLFVSPTCPHCVEELPAASKVARAANAGLVAVFIAGKAENARGVIEHTQFDGIVLIDDGTLRTKYGVRAVPYTLVLGADGTAHEVLRGAHGEQRLAEALADAR